MMQAANKECSTDEFKQEITQNLQPAAIKENH